MSTSRTINELVVFVEEESARVMLSEGLLPKIVPEHIKIRCVHFEGKQDLEKRLGGKLRAWQNPNAAFVVLRDKDSGDCIRVKQNLLEICKNAGENNVLVRIACHELESWYLGDLNAVELGLNLTGIKQKQGTAKFRSPDNLANAKQELRKLTKNSYQQVGGSRQIAPYLKPDQNSSLSFCTFVAGVRRILRS